MIRFIYMRINGNAAIAWDTVLHNHILGTQIINSRLVFQRGLTI